MEIAINELARAAKIAKSKMTDGKRLAELLSGFVGDITEELMFVQKVNMMTTQSSIQRNKMFKEAIDRIDIKLLKKLAKEEPTFIFIMGGTGSGKNYIFNKFLKGIKLVDIDKYIEEYAIEYGTDGRKQISRAVARSKRELLDSFNKKESVAQVGTGLNNKSSANKFLWAKEAGMKVAVLFIDTDLKTAMKRNQDRAKSGKQALVPDHKVERSVSQSIDNYKLYSNDRNVDFAIRIKN